MAIEEAATKIGDYVYAELVDCTPPAPESQPAQTVVALEAHAEAAEGASPTKDAQDATVTQTGSGPPPVEG